MLKDSSLEYYRNEADTSPKGSIDLTVGRGVREKIHCQLERWPNEAKPELSFGVATESRTYYIYGNDKAAVRWEMLIVSSNLEVFFILLSSFFILIGVINQL